ncbi:GNAT family N-acetyltransferase [Oceanibium sediminis]|uniref:GNAT family N-acetyltransferase n=1 Tax=Oceanibium sediminis TaxID=2026339 RepID=UPI0018E55EA7|nr:GNAT family N-acetyltransferase [Oceanibium sediminis]
MKPATPGDAPACAAILREWIAETPWFPRAHPPEAEEGVLAQKIARETVLVSGAPVQGFVALDGEYVSCLYVARAMRGRGLGQRLLAAAKARRPALRLWTFAANTGAQAFYEREGFRAVRRTDGADNAEGLPDIEYRWRAEDPT